MSEYIKTLKKNGIRFRLWLVAWVRTEELSFALSLIGLPELKFMIPSVAFPSLVLDFLLNCSDIFDFGQNFSLTLGLFVIFHALSPTRFGFIFLRFNKQLQVLNLS